MERPPPKATDATTKPALNETAPARLETKVAWKAEEKKKISETPGEITAARSRGTRVAPWKVQEGRSKRYDTSRSPGRQARGAEAETCRRGAGANGPPRKTGGPETLVRSGSEIGSATAGIA